MNMTIFTARRAEFGWRFFYFVPKPNKNTASEYYIVWKWSLVIVPQTLPLLLPLLPPLPRFFFLPDRTAGAAASVGLLRADESDPWLLSTKPCRSFFPSFPLYRDSSSCLIGQLGRQPVLVGWGRTYSTIFNEIYNETENTQHKKVSSHLDVRSSPNVTVSL